MNQCQGAGKDFFGHARKCYATNASVLPNGEVWCWQHDPARVAERQRAKALAKAAPGLLAALRAMVAHTDDLEEAWLLGALIEHDGLGGTRSNRNIDVNRQAKAAIAEAEKEE